MNGEPDTARVVSPVRGRVSETYRSNAARRWVLSLLNAVSFVDYKKYHSNKQSYHFIRRTSDRICKEHGLSVVVPGQDKGKSYAEYTAEKQGTSYKAKLKTAIDTLIPQVKDFDELLRRLQEMGYEIKQGKYISFRAAGQERFTRTKTLGAAYTEEAIKE